MRQMTHSRPHCYIWSGTVHERQSCIAASHSGVQCAKSGVRLISLSAVLAPKPLADPLLHLSNLGLLRFDNCARQLLDLWMFSFGQGLL